MPLRQFFLALLGLFTANAALAQTAAPATPPADPQNILNLDLSTGGRVSILLRPDKAPLAVERIKTLVGRGFYDGLSFHRVIEGFMAQGGDPKGTGEGGSELPDLKAEFNDLPHVRGVMSMARAQDVNSANSQFFIMLSPNLKLDRNYTAVGRVIAGMNYVDLIEKGEPPANPTKILKASMAAPGAASAAVAPPVAPPPVAAPPAVAPAPVATAPPPAAPPVPVPAPAPPPVAAAPAPAAPAVAAPAPPPAPAPVAEAAPAPPPAAPKPPVPPAQPAASATAPPTAAPAPVPSVNTTVALPPSEAAKEAEGKAAIEAAIGEALKEEQEAAKPQ